MVILNMNNFFSVQRVAVTTGVRLHFSATDEQDSANVLSELQALSAIGAIVAPQETFLIVFHVESAMTTGTDLSMN